MGKKKKALKGYDNDGEMNMDTSIFDDPEAFQKYLEELDKGGELATNSKQTSNSSPGYHEDESESGPVVTPETIERIKRSMASNTIRSDKAPKSNHDPKTNSDQKDHTAQSSTTPRQKKDNIVCSAIRGDRRIQVNGKRNVILSIDSKGRSIPIAFYQDDPSIGPVDNETLSGLITSFIEGCELASLPDVVFSLYDDSTDIDTICRLLKDEGSVSGRKVLPDGTQLHILQSKLCPDLAFGYILEPLEWQQRVGQAMLDIIPERASLTTTLINGYAFIMDTNILLLGQRIAIYQQLIHYADENEKDVEKFVNLWNSVETTVENTISTPGHTYESQFSSQFETFSELIAIDSSLNSEYDEFTNPDYDDRDLGGFDPFAEYVDETENGQVEKGTGDSVEKESFRNESHDTFREGVHQENDQSIRGGENFIPSDRKVNQAISAGEQPRQPKIDEENESEKRLSERFRSGEISAAQMFEEALNEVKKEKEEENHQKTTGTVSGDDREIREEKETKKVSKVNTPVSDEEDVSLLIDPII